VLESEELQACILILFQTTTINTHTAAYRRGLAVLCSVAVMVP
jgi:hypothetical protein